MNDTHERVSVSTFRGAGGVCSRRTPTVATRLTTCSGIREHADYTRHNRDTQTGFGLGQQRLHTLKPSPITNHF